MVKIVHVLMLVLALVSSPAFLGGCSSQDHQVVRPIEPHAPAQTRVAVPVEDERPWYENAGEVAVIVVGAVVLIGGIALPIILLSK